MAEVGRSAIPGSLFHKHPLKWLGPVLSYKTIPGTPGRFFGPRSKLQSALPRVPGGSWGIAGSPDVVSRALC